MGTTLPEGMMSVLSCAIDLCPQMTNARTALHTAPWWYRPGSASTPTTQLPAAALVPMSWSSPSWSRLEMGPRDPAFVVFLCHSATSPLCTLWLFTWSQSCQRDTPGGETYSVIAQEVYVACLGVCPVYVYHFLKSSLRKTGKWAMLVSLMLFWAGEKGGESKVTFPH